MAGLCKHDRMDFPPVWCRCDSALVTLPCGCFFKGREFFIDPFCEEHDD